MKKNNYTDKLFADPQNEIRGFKFDDSVVKVFNEMIHRSVPGYADVVKMIGVLAHRYVAPNSYCYDLGCSLGTTTLVVRDILQGRDCKIIAVDNSESMVRQCRKNIQAHTSSIPTQVLLSKIQDTVIENASFVILNLVLQFIPVEDRSRVIHQIFKGLNPGGVMILTEKICFSNSAEQRFVTDLYHEFKSLNGYSSLEISQKRTALENVLIPESLQVHRKRLLEAGFKKTHLWFQCFNFVSIIAIKPCS